MIWDENLPFLYLTKNFKVVDKDNLVVENRVGDLIVVPKKMSLAIDYLNRGKNIYFCTEEISKHFKKLGYRRLFCYYDYHCLTETLVKMGGKKYRSVRNHINKLKTYIDVRDYNDNDYKQCLTIFDLWKKQQILGKKKRMISGKAEYNEHFKEKERFGITILVAERKDNKQIIGTISGFQIDSKTWLCYLEKTDLSYNGLAEYLWHELAKRFSNLPYEMDGGGRSKGVAKLKQKWSYRKEKIYSILSKKSGGRKSKKTYENLVNK